jgi:hypothetical protein
MSKEERRRKRQEQREEEVVEVVRKLEFLESRGVDPEVTPDGKFAGFMGLGEPVGGAGGWNTDTKAASDDLHQMHKSEREREIILEAWERFQDEE